MIIYIDESGDSGFKIEKGSSRYIVISAVIFKREKDAQIVVDKINEYKKKLKYSSSYEFKFNKTNKKIILGFLKSIGRCDFEIYSVIVDKTGINLFHNVSKRKVYDYLLTVLLDKCASTKEITHIQLDGTAERALTNSIKTHLRNNLTNKIEFKFVNSATDSLIQVADIVVGSVKRSYDSKKGDAFLYIKMLEKRIIGSKEISKVDLASILVLV
jgi:hypothetical protein